MWNTAHLYRPDNFQNRDGMHGETVALDSEGGRLFTCVIANYNATFPLSFFLLKVHLPALLNLFICSD